MDEPMSGAELRGRREYLGLTGDALAAALGVSPRTLRAWEAGTEDVPTRRREGRTPVRETLDRLDAATSAEVDRLADLVRADPDLTYTVYDPEHAPPELLDEYGRRWWSHVAARAIAAARPGYAVWRTRDGDHLDDVAPASVMLTGYPPDVADNLTDGGSPQMDLDHGLPERVGDRVPAVIRSYSPRQPRTTARELATGVWIQRVS